jgi:uncharacterized membrane protein
MSQESGFSIEQALGFGWRTMTANFGKMLLYLGVPYAVLFALQIATHLPFEYIESLKSWKPITTLSDLLLASMFSLIIIKVGLRVYNDQPLSFGEIMPTGRQIWSYIGASVVVGLTVVAGVILLIVPGIIWGVKRQFFGFAMIDRELGAGDSIKLSCEITKGQVWHLLGWGLLMMVIHIAGLLCLVIGVIPAAIVTFLAQVYIYKQLAGGGAPADENRLVRPA